MKNDFHTTENRLLCPLPEAEWVRLKTQPVSVDPAPGWVVYEAGDHVDHTRSRHGRRSKLRALLVLVLSCCLSTALRAQKPASTDATQASAKATPRAGLDRSGKTRKGKASYYGQKFYSKKMADGTRMNPQSNVAASKTLPLGTKAQVTNLENGASAVVEIRDRGPYVKNRIVDVSPKTADKLGLKENGTAPVEVKPVEVPQPDGSVKPGAGAAETPRSK
ncbi:septal ring lytic transglycosylase RlpA family protein [Caballeronia sp. dw_19]|uniref:septal ring lytic transglycosylase RlpA family protein n=1 Tax=Caballeronia sp. dw_19 TaxID=2719791 RepID=UPI0021078200|nr:septal ring lytic transglycosylase RlpA family protein [Caballeronia sp. dw_19]